MVSGNVALLSATINFLTTVTATFGQMTLPIASGHVYMIDGIFPYLLDAAAYGITLGVNFPAARRAMFQTSFIAAAVAPGAGVMTMLIGDGVGGVAARTLAVVTSGTTLPRYLVVKGTLLCSGSGNLVWWGAGETNTTGKFLDGCSVIVWHMGSVTV